MRNLHFKLVPLIAVICLALMLTARALGTTQPPNPALRGFSEGCEDKPQPCWYGIVPGVTTAEELEAIQKERLQQVIFDLRDSCHVSVKTENDYVYGIWMDNCADMTLGDFVAYLGTPDYFINDCYAGTDYTFDYSVHVESRTDWNSPFSSVNWASVHGAYALTRDLSRIDYIYLWQGFRSEQTYQRLQPDVQCVNRG